MPVRSRSLRLCHVCASAFANAVCPRTHSQSRTHAHTHSCAHAQRERCTHAHTHSCAHTRACTERKRESDLSVRSHSKSPQILQCWRVCDRGHRLPHKANFARRKLSLTVLGPHEQGQEEKLEATPHAIGVSACAKDVSERVGICYGAATALGREWTPAIHEKA